MAEAKSLHTVIETPEYLRRASRVLSAPERTALVDRFAIEPQAGELMQGTGGARKLRLAARGKGKSGGARAITYYAGPDLPVFLLTVFGKGEKANLSRAERNELKEILGGLARAYKGK